MSDNVNDVASVEFNEGTLCLRHWDRCWLDRLNASVRIVADSRVEPTVYRCDAVHFAAVRAVFDEMTVPDATPVRDTTSGAGHRATSGGYHRATSGGYHRATSGGYRRATSGTCRIGEDWDLVIPDRRGIRLRPDQSAAVEAFENHHRRGVIVMPTGTGKTVVAIELMIRSAMSTLVVVPVRDLMYQWHQKILDATGVDAGIIGDGVYRVSPISVTTYDSAAIHMARIGGRFGMIIFDEAHHLSGQWRAAAARMSAATVRLGLTATPPPDHHDADADVGPDPKTAAGVNAAVVSDVDVAAVPGVHAAAVPGVHAAAAPGVHAAAVLRDAVGPVVHRQEIAEARGRTLAQYRIRRITVAMTQSESEAHRRYGKMIQDFVGERRGEDPRFRWEDTHRMVADPDVAPELSAAASDALDAFRAKRRIEEHAAGKFRVLEDLFRLHADQPVIVFTGTNVMAREISLRFMVPCLLSHCAKRERRQYIAGFAEGRYRVLVANRVLDEGVDLPAVNTAIVVGGMASGRQAIQRLGRVLRRDGRGTAATLYEVVTDASGEVQRSRNRRRNAAYQN